MISVIITSANEPKTISRAISCILDKAYSGYSEKLQLIVAAPDRPTLTAALRTVKEFDLTDYVEIQDPGKGKPLALNLALKQAKGELVIFTDGDVYLSRHSVKKLVEALEKFPELGGVSGRQFSIDDRNQIFGYYSYLFADALDKIRRPMQGVNPANIFFPMSGYVMAVRRKLIDFELPENVLVDDGYLSYMIYNKDYRIGYEPEAAAYVSYPKNSEDYFKQKVRSTGGYQQLKQFGIVSVGSRSIAQDLQNITFPLTYAQRPKEFIWSLMLYALRFNLWLRIFFLKLFAPAKLGKSWQRVESTK